MFCSDLEYHLATCQMWHCTVAGHLSFVVFELLHELRSTDNINKLIFLLRMILTARKEEKSVLGKYKKKNKK